MKAKTDQRTRKVRVLQAERLPKKSWLDVCLELRDEILAERGGELMPDSTELIREMREGDE